MDEAAFLKSDDLDTAPSLMVRNYFAGMQRLAAGQTAEAAQLFRQVLTKGDKRWMVFDFSAAEDLLIRTGK